MVKAFKDFNFVHGKIKSVQQYILLKAFNPGNLILLHVEICQLG